VKLGRRPHDAGYAAGSFNGLLLPIADGVVVCDGAQTRGRPEAQVAGYRTQLRINYAPVTVRIRMSEHLHHKLSALHQSLLHGKLPRTLHWGDALELIGHLGQVEPRGEDEFAFIVGTQREVFKRPRTPEFGTDEVSRLRRFLKNAGAETSTM
jgi:hypothetical protein